MLEPGRHQATPPQGPAPAPPSAGESRARRGPRALDPPPRPRAGGPVAPLSDVPGTPLTSRRHAIDVDAAIIGRATRSPLRRTSGLSTSRAWSYTYTGRPRSPYVELLNQPRTVSRMDRARAVERSGTGDSLGRSHRRDRSPQHQQGRPPRGRAPFTRGLHGWSGRDICIARRVGMLVYIIG